MIKIIISLLLVSNIVLADGRIKNADINSAAAIAHSKMAAQTANGVCRYDASGFATSLLGSSSGDVLTWNGSAWASTAPAGSGWGLTGNSGTTAGTNFVGTTDAQDVVIKRNSSEIARATSTGWLSSLLYGSSSASGTLTLQSTSNATKGVVKIANQTGEKTELGPVGTVTTPYGTHSAYTPSGSSLANAFVVQGNNGNLAFSGSSGALGIALIPNFGTLPEIRSASDNGRMLIRSYSYGGGGELGGYIDVATNYFGFQNSLAGYRVLNISGTTGQSAELVAFYNQTSYANQVAAIGKSGEFRAPAGTTSLPGHAFFGDTNNGWWAPAADTQAWSLAGTEKMRLDSTGLGIGVTPAQSLDVSANARIRGLSTAGAVVNDSTGLLSSVAPGTSGNVLTSNGTAWTSAAPSGGAGGDSVFKSTTITAHGFSVGDILYLNGSTWTKAISTSAAASESIAMVTTVTDANTVVLTYSGYVSGLSGLTAGTVYFLSPTTAGAMTATEPTTAGQISKPVGVALSSTTFRMYDSSRGAVISSGSSSFIDCEMTYDSANGFGSTNTAVRRWSTNRKNTGSCMTYADSSTLGGKVTVNEAGIYAIQWHDVIASPPGIMGLFINGTNGAGNARTSTYAQGLRALGAVDSANQSGSISWTGRLAVNDYIWFQSSASGLDTSSTNQSMFTIIKVGN